MKQHVIDKPTEAAHELKVWSDPFQKTWAGIKPFEVRTTGDRDFRVGDLLLLREVEKTGSREVPFSYTGRAILAQVPYIATNAPPSPLSRGVVVLTLQVLHLIQFFEAGTTRPAALNIILTGDGPL